MIYIKLFNLNFFDNFTFSLQFLINILKICLMVRGRFIVFEGLDRSGKTT